MGDAEGEMPKGSVFFEGGPAITSLCGSCPPCRAATAASVLSTTTRSNYAVVSPCCAVLYEYRASPLDRLTLGYLGISHPLSSVVGKHLTWPGHADDLSRRSPSIPPPARPPACPFVPRLQSAASLSHSFTLRVHTLDLFLFLFFLPFSV